MKYAARHNATKYADNSRRQTLCASDDNEEDAFEEERLSNGNNPGCANAKPSSRLEGNE